MFDIFWGIFLRKRFSLVDSNCSRKEINLFFKYTFFFTDWKGCCWSSTRTKDVPKGHGTCSSRDGLCLTSQRILCKVFVWSSLTTCSSFHSIDHKQIYTEFLSAALDWNEVFEECDPLFYTKVALMTSALELWQTKGMSKPFVFICITFPTGVKQSPALYPSLPS